MVIEVKGHQGIEIEVDCGHILQLKSVLLKKIIQIKKCKPIRQIFYIFR